MVKVSHLWLVQLCEMEFDDEPVVHESGTNEHADPEGRTVRDALCKYLNRRFG